MPGSGEPIIERFSPAPNARWQRFVVGGGALEATGSTLRFVVTNATGRKYANAQIDDYQGLPRRRFLWKPPLRLAVRARFSHPVAREGAAISSQGSKGEAHGLRGTAGFGFWNDPFLMTGMRVPTLPRAAWFFHASPPSDMKLDLDTPGRGWKVATIDALRPAALTLAPLALPAAIVMNVPRLYQALWPPIQRALQVRETELAADMREWHTYVLEWGTERARFYVDPQPAGWVPEREDGGGAAVLVGTPAPIADPALDAPAPRGPLGFVMWLDNQYLVVTPWGRLKWGLLDIEGEQWMEVDWLSIEPEVG